MKNDVDVVRSVLQGDQDAYRFLVDKYKQAVYSVVLSRVHDETEAQDLTQESFIRAYMNIESLKDMAKFGQWISGIARNVAGKWLERTKRHESLEGLIEMGADIDTNTSPFQWVASVGGVDETLQKEQMRQMLWKGIYELPEVSQNVLLLSYMREMNRKKIAEFLGISEAAVRNRLHKSRKQLKKEMLKMLENTAKSQKLPENFTDEVISEAMKRGQQYLEEKQWEQAKKEFQRIADIQEDYAPAYKGIGLAARGTVLEQLKAERAPIDKNLLEEAYQELSRAYRLGARDWDTVWTLGKLYGQFGRYAEQTQLFLDFSKTASKPSEAFKADFEAIQSMGTGQEQYQRAVEHHRKLIAQFAEKVSAKEQLESFWMLYFAYVETGLYDEWLDQTKRLESKAFPVSFHERMAYACWRSDAYFQTKRYRESIQVGEAFLDFMDSHPTFHPHRRWYLLDIYAVRLLSSYRALGQQEKIEEAFRFIESTLEKYEDERRQKISELENQSCEPKAKQTDESELRKLDSVYEGMGVESGEVYPLGGSREQIRRWLDEMYKSGIDNAYHDTGCGFAWIGEGEKAIHLFLKKRAQRDGNHHVWLAAFLLQFREDRKSALSHLKQAAEDRGYVASGGLKRAFERFDEFEPVRADPEFMAIVNASVIAE